MILVNSSFYEGMPCRLYRTPEQIRTDIVDVKRKIDRITEMLNSRNVVGEMLDCLAEGSYTDWIPLLKGVVGEAENTLHKLSELNTTLDELNEELEETKCVLKI